MKVIADKFIPFLQGRLEPLCSVEYIHPDEFTAESVRDADALLIRTRTKCGAPLLQGSRVQMIATATIGMDQFDLPWCHSHGIATYNSPGCNAPGVAQWVYASLLHIGEDLRGKTIGIIGHGHVGSIVAEWGRHLGARVLLNDPPKAKIKEKREERRDITDFDCEYLSLEEMLPQCDIVTLHTPLTREGEHATWHLFGEKEAALCRPRTILINAARGPVIDSQAIARAPHLRLLTDVWEGEPRDLNADILRRSEVATFHIAGYSLQGKQRATRMVLESLARHFGLPIDTEAASLTPGAPCIKVSDLPAPYRPVAALTADEIKASYNPLADTQALRANPAAFEHLRDHYNYRSEPPSTLR